MFQIFGQAVGQGATTTVGLATVMKVSLAVVPFTASTLSMVTLPETGQIIQAKIEIEQKKVMTRNQEDILSPSLKRTLLILNEPAQVVYLQSLEGSSVETGPLLASLSLDSTSIAESVLKTKSSPDGFMVVRRASAVSKSSSSNKSGDHRSSSDPSVSKEVGSTKPESLRTASAAVSPTKMESQSETHSVSENSSSLPSTVASDTETSDAELPSEETVPVDEALPVVETSPAEEASPSNQWGPWNDWTKRALMKLNAQMEVEDFPVLVEISPDKFNYLDFDYFGNDIRFVSSMNLDQALPYQMERWNPGGISRIWVRIPKVEVTREGVLTSLIMYYHNPMATEDTTAPLEVWKDTKELICTGEKAHDADQESLLLASSTEFWIHGIPAPLRLGVADGQKTDGDLSQWFYLNLSASQDLASEQSRNSLHSNDRIPASSVKQHQELLSFLEDHLNLKIRSRSTDVSQSEVKQNDQSSESEKERDVLQQEVDQMKDERAQEERKLHQSQTTLSLEDTKFHGIQADLSSQKDSLNQLNSRRDTKKDQVNTSQNALNEKRSKISKLKESLNEKKQLHQQVAKAKKDDNKKDDNKKDDNKKDDNKKDDNKKDDNKKSKNSKNDNDESNMKELEKQEELLLSEIGTMESSISSEETALAKMEVDLANIQLDLGQLENSISAAQTSLNDSKLKESVQNEKMDEIRNSIGKSKGKISDLEQEIMKFENLIGEIDSRINAHDRKEDRQEQEPSDSVHLCKLAQNAIIKIEYSTEARSPEWRSEQSRVIEGQYVEFSDIEEQQVP